MERSEFESKYPEQHKKYSKLIISLPGNSTQETLKKISAFFDKCSIGTTKVYIQINNTKLETPYCIENQATLKNDILTAIPEAGVDIY